METVGIQGLDAGESLGDLPVPLPEFRAERAAHAEDRVVPQMTPGPVGYRHPDLQDTFFILFAIQAIYKYRRKAGTKKNYGTH
jgi:hypothetical protein